MLKKNKLSISCFMIKIGIREKEADFPGGTTKWVKYLQKNLHMPDRATSLKICGTVITSFCKY
jgi:hypothetical protein